MNNSVVILIYKIVDNRIVSTIRDEKNASSALDMVMRTFLSAEDAHFDFEKYDENKLSLNLSQTDLDDLITIEALESSELSAVDPDSLVRLNFPTLIKCQNCETNFPTKYQYQRHQCDFNAEKVIFKSSPENLSVMENNDENEKPVFECPVCLKFFANKNNLDRHQVGHTSTNDNICEFCGKHFVSENRLRIHKENHCKKAGDISKFYRSDVTVWKCKKCHEVFSSLQIANHHVSLCQEILDMQGNEHPDKENIEVEPQDNTPSNNDNDGYSKSNQLDNKYTAAILTEILLQCEFCNRTFSDKNLLLMHQRKHTTAKNYECVNCNKTFDSYPSAASHWLKRCSEFANLFYLPKLSYCEYCDRTFKSHEILYNHKIKKKHYTPKLHIAVNVERDNVHDDELKSAPENKDIINKLIQDVLKTLEAPVSTKINVESDNKSFVDVSIINIKTEPDSGNTSSTSTHQIEQNDENQENIDETSSKSGKKRKWHKTTRRSKKYCITTDEGFKYQCERCIKVFNCIVSLEAHRTSEHVAAFCCEECGQTLGSAKALLIHCRAHKSLKPYVCDTCGRSYSQTSHLWQHMRFHQGIKPFACPHEGCEARYTIRPDLKDHIRKVHTRERPFKCNVCNKCFLTGSVYYQHRLIHTNDRRYGCEVCQKRFFRADALNNHKRIHTDERPYPCSVCGREFRQKGDRNKHVRTQHPDFFTSVL